MQSPTSKCSSSLNIFPKRDSAQHNAGQKKVQVKLRRRLNCTTFPLRCSVIYTSLDLSQDKSIQELSGNSKWITCRCEVHVCRTSKVEQTFHVKEHTYLRINLLTYSHRLYTHVVSFHFDVSECPHLGKLTVARSDFLNPLFHPTHMQLLFQSKVVKADRTTVPLPAASLVPTERQRVELFTQENLLVLSCTLTVLAAKYPGTWIFAYVPCSPRSVIFVWLCW